MGDKHGWHHSSIPDNYPDDALDLKKIYMSVHAGEAKSSVNLMYFPNQIGLFLKNTVGYQKDIIQVISNGALSA
jgi:hypothetical protein